MNASHARSWRGGLVLAGLLGLIALAAAGSAALARQRDPAAAAAPPPPQEKLRLGTYDSRAVAVAYGRSEEFLARTKDLHERHERAKEAGDQKTADGLAKEGQQLQVRIHLQGFSNAPVDEILTQVQGRLPEVAAKAGVVAIVPAANYRDEARVEVVDVTDELVSLFDPDEQTQKIIADLKKQPPLPIEQVAMMDHKGH